MLVTGWTRVVTTARFGIGATAAELCTVKLVMEKKTGAAQFDSALSTISVIEVGKSPLFDIQFSLTVLSSLQLR